jgi:type I restriction enzyme S subunit
VEWLGEVPAHWRWGRLRYLTSELVDGTHHSPASFPSGDRLYITAKNIKEAGVDLTDVSYVSEEIHEEIYSRCPVLTGDVLYIKDGATAGVATVNQLAEPFSLLSSVALLRPAAKHIEARYLAYMLNGSSFKQDALNRVVGGAMTRLTLDMISRFVVSLPPLPEQQAIAEFLDRETAKIDALIAEQERLIELLQEKRQAVISHAVTKGLDPSVPMKSSGVEWLGEVPAHWSRSSLKRLARYENGFPYKPDDRGEVGLPIIRISQLTSNDPPAYFDGDIDGHVPIFDGDLLFSWSASIDAHIWSRGAALLNQHIFKVVPEMQIDKRYLFHVIRHVAPKLADFDAHGSTMRHIKKESLGEVVYTPPLPEQRAIAEFLDRETTKIDVLIAASKSAITVLNERRSVLISAAVTGQIDVRNAVAVEAA